MDEQYRLQAETEPKNQSNYTIKAAAVRVGRSERTIERWIERGMKCREVAGMIVIDHADLIRMWKRQLRTGKSPKVQSASVSDT